MVFEKPIYFVLGNHDYHNSSFDKVENTVARVTEEIPHLHWLNENRHTQDSVAIVGVSGWYDFYNGNANTKIEIVDMDHIEDFRKVLYVPGSQRKIIRIAREKASDESSHLGRMLKVACLEKANTVIVCTHVPLYPEAAMNKGKQSDRDWLPWFSSASTGKVLDVFSEKYPEKMFIVLCGHSHSPGIFQKRDNMVVFTGKARYGHPDLAGTIDIDNRIVSAYDKDSEKVCYILPMDNESNNTVMEESSQLAAATRRARAAKRALEHAGCPIPTAEHVLILPNSNAMMARVHYE